MSNISSRAAAAREAARSDSGQFGTQTRTAPTPPVPRFTDADLEQLYQTGSQNQIELMSVQMLAERVREEYPTAAFVELSNRYSDDGNPCVDRVVDADGNVLADCTPWADQEASDWAGDNLWHLASNLRSDGEWVRTCSTYNGDYATVVVAEAVTIDDADIDNQTFDTNRPGRHPVDVPAPKGPTMEMSAGAVGVGETVLSVVDVKLAPGDEPTVFTVTNVIQVDRKRVVLEGTEPDGRPIQQLFENDRALVVQRKGR